MSLADRIAQSVIKKYNELPKRGKPTVKGKGAQTKEEWTVLAGFVLENTQTSQLECVSLGTGLKCQHREQLSPYGDSLHDSHAEVIARRALLVYLIDHFQDIFTKQDARYVFPRHLQLHLYTSRCPCGDASIEPLDDKLSDSTSEQPKAKRQRISQDPLTIVRGHQDFDSLGSLRLKPGRADSIPTLSMSCSDKIAKWNALGVQGSLLAMLMAPLYISSIVVGDLYNHKSIDRAINQRGVSALAGKDLPRHYRANICSISHTTVEFKKSQVYLKAKGVDVITADASICWYHGLPPQKSVALVNGSKQGAKLALSGCQPHKLWPSICKISLLNRFLSVYEKLEPQGYLEFQQHIYKSIKQQSTEYQQAKRQLLESSLFKDWVQCPAMYESFDRNGSIN
ncbi:hypothetical protein LPJ78_002049 [Coemansia sp. RSA 989]|nr:hypothetical protein LPJ78_002049 [Coemansia sp. RSA 989]